MIKTYLTIGIALSTFVMFIGCDHSKSVKRISMIDVVAGIVVYVHSVIFWPWYLYCGWKRAKK